MADFDLDNHMLRPQLSERPLDDRYDDLADAGADDPVSAECVRGIEQQAYQDRRDIEHERRLDAALAQLVLTYRRVQI